MITRIGNIITKKANLIMLALPFFWLLLIFILFNISNPLQVGPAGVLVVFILFYGLASSLIFILLVALSGFFKLVLKRIIGRKDMYYLASVLAFAPIFLIGLNTLNQLGPIELALVIVLVAIGCFYVIKRRPD